MNDVETLVDHHAQTLLDWLAAQSGSIATLEAFQLKAAETARRHPGLSACCVLLIGLSERFVAAVSDTPVTSADAQAVHCKLLDLLSRSISIQDLDYSSRLQALNALALETLI
jgi:hypothetical protein